MFIVPTTTEPGHRLAAIMAGMAAVVAHHVAGLRAISSALVPMLSLLTWRLGRVAQRLDRLMLRWQAGTLPQPRPVRAPRRRPAAEASPPIYVPPIYVPQGHAWLIHLVQPTAQYMPQLERFLADPQTRALVAAAPQAGRLLRPLCRMLAIAPPEWLRLPARPRPLQPAPVQLAPVQLVPVHPAPVQPAPQPGTPDRPLPPYIRAAVRAWKRRGE